MGRGLQQFAQDAKSFMLAAGIRAIKTMCQTAIALIGTARSVSPTLTGAW